MKKSNTRVNYPKPILKWVGGKGKILDTLIAKFPTHINNYYEPFLGGGSVLFALLKCVQTGSIVVSGTIHAYDANTPLIHVYKNIQTNPNGIFECIQLLINEYNALPDIKNTEIQTRESFYYTLRTKYNEMSLEEKCHAYGSAMFVFLNKTGFRGMFREGPNGFNIPYGNYSSPEIVNKLHLDEIHLLIQGVIFESRDFTWSISQALDGGDFVYLDPPYAAETKTSFVGYTKNGFGATHNSILFAMCDAACCGIMISNANVDIVREHFTSEKKYITNTIVCKRSINSKNPKSTAVEVIITNY